MRGICFVDRFHAVITFGNSPKAVIKMKTCKNEKSGAYYRYQNCNWGGGAKIIKLLLFSIVVMVLLTTSILTANAGHSKELPISESVTLRIKIPPRAGIKIDEAKIDAKFVSVDSKELLNAISRDDGSVFVDKVSRNGVEMTRVTKVFYESLDY